MLIEPRKRGKFTSSVFYLAYYILMLLQKKGGTLDYSTIQETVKTRHPNDPNAFYKIKVALTFLYALDKVEYQKDYDAIKLKL